MATPLLALTLVVVPVAKPVGVRVSLMVSVDPVFPVVITLPNWSCTATPTVKAVPADTVVGGVVNTSLFSAAGMMSCRCARTLQAGRVAESVGEPAAVSP